MDQQQRRVRPAVRRADGVRARVPRPRAAPGARRLRALHAALHHLVLPGGVPADAAVQVAVHQPRQVLRAGPGGGLRRRLRGKRRGGGEPQAALRAPRRQRHRPAMGVVGLRHGLQDPLLHEGEEVHQDLRRGRRHRARSVTLPAAGAGSRHTPWMDGYDISACFS